MKQFEAALGIGLQTHAQCAVEALVAPLRKRRSSGELYERSPQIETLIAELAIMSRDQLIDRAAIAKRTDPLYVPSECLIHFIRASRNDNGETWFERLYRILVERVLRSLPRAEHRSGGTESLTRGTVREKVSGRLAELLSTDRVSYDDRLDYFEIRFDSALVRLRKDAQRQAWRDENRSEPLENDEDSGELSPEIEAAAGIYDPFNAPDFDDPGYRSSLDAAIEMLPTEQCRIVHMLRQGFPIDSKEPNVMTIAKALGRSEKTIRTHRDKAFAALRLILADGEKE
jgi:hypothetical protein